MESSTPDQSKIKFEQLHEGFNRSLTSIAPFATILWKRRKKFLLVNVAVALITIALLLLFAGPYFESDVSILPDYGNKPMLVSFSTGIPCRGFSWRNNAYGHL